MPAGRTIRFEGISQCRFAVAKNYGVPLLARDRTLEQVLITHRRLLKKVYIMDGCRQAFTLFISACEIVIGFG